MPSRRFFAYAGCLWTYGGAVTAAFREHLAAEKNDAAAAAPPAGPHGRAPAVPVTAATAGGAAFAASPAAGIPAVFSIGKAG